MKHFSLIFLFVAVLFQGACTHEKKPSGTALPVIMDMVFNNPGEAPVRTKYNDPVYLKEIGYKGMVPEWFVQCAVTYDSFKKNIIPEGSVERKWILNKQKEIHEKLLVAEKEQMPVYAFTDVLVLPTIILQKFKHQIIREAKDAGNPGVIGGKMIPDINKPLTQELLRVQIDEIFSTFPELDGLVIRFGETYLFDTPYHAGGSPLARGGQQAIDDHVKLINLLREEVCVKRNKKLFYRTWDFGFFHTRPDVYLAITGQIQPHKNLYFSIKYPKGDFQRLFPFNPTLGIGKHQYIVEYQCQPEYYGKGAHPDYVFNGFLNGFEEYSQLMKPGDKWGVKDLKGDPNFKGVWTWSRGGGWRGPYITNELWCDVNALTALEWARDTTLSESQALKKAAMKIGVSPDNVDDFIRLVHLSARGVVRGHCSLIDIPRAHFNVWWIRDHFMSDMHTLDPFFDYLMKQDKVEMALREKQEAVDIWREMEKLAGRIKMKDPADQEYLSVSVTYGRIKYEIIEKAFTVILLGHVGDKTGKYEKKRIRKAINEYDHLWEEWRALKKDHPSCASLYEPYAFHIDKNGVSGDKEHGLEARIDQYRNL